MALRYDPEIQSVAIVFVGKFNPAIFSPAWLARTGIVTDKESAAAKVEIIHSEISQFEIDPFSIDVQPNRLQIRTSTEPFVRSLDLATMLFQGNLPHTPIDKFGINYEILFALDSFEQRVALGRALAPVEPWGSFGKRMESVGPEGTGGMVALVMQDSDPGGRPGGWRRVQIGPSLKPDPRRGVRLVVNDHYDILDSRDELGAAAGISLLRDQFETSIEAAREVASQIMEYASNLS